MGHVSLEAITGTTALVPYHLGYEWNLLSQFASLYEENVSWKNKFDLANIMVTAWVKEALGANVFWQNVFPMKMKTMCSMKVSARVLS